MNREKAIELGFIVSLLVLGSFYIYLASQTALLGEDEVSYFILGKQIAGLGYPELDYLGNPNVAPPFIPLSYASIFSILGDSLAVAKIVSVIFGILTVAVVYLLGKKVNIYVGIFSATILLLMQIFTNFMLIAYVDVPIAFFSILSVYLFSNLNSGKSAVMLGAVMGLSYYVKESGMFIPLALLLYSLLEYYVHRNKNVLKLCSIAVAISLSFILLMVVRNLVLFDYPYNIMLNMLFTPPATPSWYSAALITPSMSTLADYIGIFGMIPLFLSLFGITYIVTDRRNIKPFIKFSAFLLVSFVAISMIMYASGRMIADARYFLVVFPEMALVIGFFLWKAKEYNKYAMALILPIILLSFFTSITVATSTSQTQRFSEDYVNALNWIEENSPQDSIVFTTYGGSTKYYADRTNIWQSISEFPELMTSNDSMFIYNTLKSYNVSYILIWNGVISQNYIIPESNIIGVFTYNFLDQVTNDADRFSIEYQNQGSVVLKLV